MIEKLPAPTLAGVGSFDGPAQITPESLLLVLDAQALKLNEIIDAVNVLLAAHPKLHDGPLASSALLEERQRLVRSIHRQTFGADHGD